MYHPVQGLSDAYGAAFYRDLPDVTYTGRAKDTPRRPYESEITVQMFPQQWESTALGYDTIGGSSMETAHTFIILHELTGYAAVYFGLGGRLAYLVNLRTLDSRGLENWHIDICWKNMSPVTEYKEKYTVK